MSTDVDNRIGMWIQDIPYMIIDGNNLDKIQRVYIVSEKDYSYESEIQQRIRSVCNDGLIARLFQLEYISEPYKVDYTIRINGTDFISHGNVISFDLVYELLEEMGMDVKNKLDQQINKKFYSQIYEGFDVLEQPTSVISKHSNMIKRYASQYDLQLRSRLKHLSNFAILYPMVVTNVSEHEKSIIDMSNITKRYLFTMVYSDDVHEYTLYILDKVFKKIYRITPKDRTPSDSLLQMYDTHIEYTNFDHETIWSRRMVIHDHFVYFLAISDVLLSKPHLSIRGMSRKDIGEKINKDSIRKSHSIETYISYFTTKPYRRYNRKIVSKYHSQRKKLGKKLLKVLSNPQKYKQQITEQLLKDSKVSSKSKTIDTLDDVSDHLDSISHTLDLLFSPYKIDPEDIGTDPDTDLAYKYLLREKDFENMKKILDNLKFEPAKFKDINDIHYIPNEAEFFKSEPTINYRTSGKCTMNVLRYVDRLIYKGADLDYKNSKGDTALSICVARKEYFALWSLLNHGCSIEELKVPTSSLAKAYSQTDYLTWGILQYTRGVELLRYVGYLPMSMKVYMTKVSSYYGFDKKTLWRSVLSIFILGIVFVYISSGWSLPITVYNTLTNMYQYVSQQIHNLISMVIQQYKDIQVTPEFGTTNVVDDVPATRLYRPNSNVPLSYDTLSTDQRNYNFLFGKDIYSAPQGLYPLNNTTQSIGTFPGKLL